MNVMRSICLALFVIPIIYVLVGIFFPDSVFGNLTIRHIMFGVCIGSIVPWLVVFYEVYDHFNDVKKDLKQLNKISNNLLPISNNIKVFEQIVKQDNDLKNLKIQGAESLRELEKVKGELEKKEVEYCILSKKYDDYRESNPGLDYDNFCANFKSLAIKTTQHISKSSKDSDSRWKKEIDNLLLVMKGVLPKIAGNGNDYQRQQDMAKTIWGMCPQKQMDKESVKVEAWKVAEDETDSVGDVLRSEEKGLNSKGRDVGDLTRG